MTVLGAATVASSLAEPAQRPAPKAPAKPAARPAAPAAEVKAPFAAGETLTYDVGWSTYFTAGTATMRVQERRELGGGRAAYVLVAEGKPGSVLSKLYDLYYKAETQLDTRSMQPITSSVFSKEGTRTRVKTTHFRGAAARTADYEVRTTTVNKRQLSVPQYTQDALAAIYVLRTLPFKAPDMIRMPITTGGEVYRATINYGAPEAVRTGAGTFQAYKLSISAIDTKGQPAARSMHVWFSNDQRRLPVKIEAGLPVGAFTLTLASAR